MIREEFQKALYVITDRALSKGRSHLNVMSSAIAGGAKIIQLRDKECTAGELVQEGLVLRELTKRKGVLLIVNDRVDIALAIDADGAHLGQDDLPAKLARKMLGSDKIIGVSTGNAEEAIQAVEDSADYVSIGPIFSTATKLDAGESVGIHIITEFKKRVNVPVVAIGGITQHNIAQVSRAGADCAAVISAVYRFHRNTALAMKTNVVAADDVEAAARELLDEFLGGIKSS